MGNGLLEGQYGSGLGLQSVPVNLEEPLSLEDGRVVAAQQTVQLGHSPRESPTRLALPLHGQLQARVL